MVLKGIPEGLYWNSAPLKNNEWRKWTVKQKAAGNIIGCNECSQMHNKAVDYIDSFQIGIQIIRFNIVLK